MFLQVLHQVIPLVDRSSVQSLSTSAADSKPDAIDTHQITNPSEGEARISQRLTMTRVHDVDDARSKFDYRPRRFAHRRLNRSWKAGQPLFENLGAVSNRKFDELLPFAIDLKKTDGSSQTFSQQRDSIPGGSDCAFFHHQPQLLEVRRPRAGSRI